MTRASLTYDPAIAFVVITMVTALLGNLSVLVVFNWHWRSTGATKIYILVLAGLDLVCALVSAPRELVTLESMARGVNGTANVSRCLVAGDSKVMHEFCKVSVFLTYQLNFTSALILVAIALSRLLKVMPDEGHGLKVGVGGGKGGQGKGKGKVERVKVILRRLVRSVGTVRGAKIVSVFSFASSFVFISPVLAFVGNVDDNADTACFKTCKMGDDETMTSLNAVYFALFTLLAIVLVLLYYHAIPRRPFSSGTGTSSCDRSSGSRKEQDRIRTRRVRLRRRQSSELCPRQSSALFPCPRRSGSLGTLCLQQFKPRDGGQPVARTMSAGGDAASTAAAAPRLALVGTGRPESHHQQEKQFKRGTSTPLRPAAGPFLDAGDGRRETGGSCDAQRRRGRSTASSRQRTASDTAGPTRGRLTADAGRATTDCDSAGQSLAPVPVAVATSTTARPVIPITDGPLIPKADQSLTPLGGQTLTPIPGGAVPFTAGPAPTHTACQSLPSTAGQTPTLTACQSLPPTLGPAPTHTAYHRRARSDAAEVTRADPDDPALTPAAFHSLTTPVRARAESDATGTGTRGDHSLVFGTQWGDNPAGVFFPPVSYSAEQRSVLNLQMAARTHRHQRDNSNTNDDYDDGDDDDGEEYGGDDYDDDDDDDGGDDDRETIGHRIRLESVSSFQITAKKKTRGNNIILSNSRSSSSNSSGKNKVKRSTLVFFAVTVVFIASFLPYFVFTALPLPAGGAAGWVGEVLYRSFLISNAANPVLYGLCNPHFRSTLWRLIVCRTEVI